MTSRAVLPLLLLIGCTGCRNDMQDQPRYKPLQPGKLFVDGRSARPLPDGVIPRGQLRSADPLFYTGRNAGPAPSTPATQGATFAFDPGLATELPMPVTAELLATGRSQFETFCIPCHGYLGNGRGMVVQRGFSPPPSYHIDRLRAAPAGHFFDVMTNGYGAMFSYASRISPANRWAIVAYIRALQLSQNAALEDVPPDHRADLQQNRRLPSSQGGEIETGAPPRRVQPDSPKPGGAR